jgi:hypothetical protein
MILSADSADASTVRVTGLSARTIAALRAAMKTPIEFSCRGIALVSASRRSSRRTIGPSGLFDWYAPVRPAETDRFVY